VNLEKAGKEELNTKDGYRSKEEECHGNETKKEHATDKKAQSKK